MCLETRTSPDPVLQEMFVFLNGRLLHTALQQLDTVVLPQGVH
jgi:hypothetical protein